MKNISGIEKVVFSDMPPYTTIVIEGDTGTLKTTFALECIKANLEAEPDKVCLYFSLKEDKSYFENHHSIKPLIDQKRLLVIDYAGLVELLQPQVLRKNIFEGISNVASGYKKKLGEKLSMIGIDPINVLETFINQKHIRRFLFHFFSELNDLKTTNWIVMESYDLTGESTAILPYHFLADGIICLGMSETLDDVVRYLEIIKMRGVCHSLKKFQISYKKSGFNILSAIYED
ncbi:MAG: hypothetical protein LWY06_11535 [Firmicutes bacterium]|nr:hypothetical protein [Bacillota bacterium]